MRYLHTPVKNIKAVEQSLYELSETVGLGDALGREARVLREAFQNRRVALELILEKEQISVDNSGII